MDKRIFKMIEKHLYNQKRIELAVAEAKEELLASKKEVGSGGSRGSFVSDPTARDGIILATSLPVVDVPGMGEVYLPEEWIKIFNAAYAAQGEKKRQILKRRYYYRTASVIHLGIDYGMSTKSVYNLCTSFVVDIALRLAHKVLTEYGLN